MGLRKEAFDYEKPPFFEQDNFLEDLDETESLSSYYDVPAEDIILTAMNLSGIKSSEVADDRIRFQFQLGGLPKSFFMALCVNTRKTPFELRDQEVYFAGDRIGFIFDPEKDTCDRSYFRRNNSSLTLNSNARSTCQGCAMCGTYSQEVDDLFTLDTKGKLLRHFENIFTQVGLEDASDLIQTTICTGCFEDEEEAVSHVLLVNDALESIGFSGTLRYIGSEIVSPEALDVVDKKVDDFALSLTTEVFTRRHEILRPHKASLSLEKTKDVLDEASARNMKANILYVAGLDPLDTTIERFQDLAPHMSEFPVINLMQNYITEHEDLRDSGARDIEYFLKARKKLEKIFQPLGLKPNSWENYRPLWYTSYAGESIL